MTGTDIFRLKPSSDPPSVHGVQVTEEAYKSGPRFFRFGCHNLCRKAADDAFLRSIREDDNTLIDQVTLLRIAQEVRPSVAPHDLKRFLRYRDEGV